MALCEACVEAARELSAVIRTGYEIDGSRNPIRHGQYQMDLQIKCPLCRLLQHCLQKQDQEDESLIETEAAEMLPGWESEYASAVVSTARRQPRLRYLYVSRGHDSELLSEKTAYFRPVELGVYAPVSSEGPLSKSVWCRHPFPQTGSQDAMLLFKTWLHSCLSKHKACGHDDFGATLDHDNPLPSRILDVASPNGSSEIRLVESNGKRGRWIALSHCWGPPDKMPLRTTRSNLRGHLIGINMQELPKTFQDAVEVTRALEIRYLWIDSLCIVQDDAADWRQESSTMGNTYQQATLTIAASHAKNGSEGCFSPQKQHQRTRESNIPETPGEVSLPFFQDDNVVSCFSVCWRGTEVAGDTVSENNLLLQSPLFKRGWVMQEWVLSRRTLLFFEGSVWWCCRELCEDELGNNRKLTRPFLFDWDKLVQQYTKTTLSYQTDKLPAIQGMANILREKGRGNYFAGMWTNDLPDCLLWKVGEEAGKPAPERSYLPSWTWASIDAAVTFQLHGIGRHGLHSNVKNAFRELTLRPSGALYFDGPMTHLKTGMLQFVARNDGTQYKYKSLFKQAFKGYSNCRKAGGSIYGNQLVMLPSKSPRLKLFDQSEFAGWATLDLDIIPDVGAVYCVAIKREIGVIWGDGWRSDAAQDAYHVLVLQASSDSGQTPRYVRIGMGVVAEPCRPWYDGHCEII